MASPIQTRSSVSSLVLIIIWNCSTSPRALTSAGTAASMWMTRVGRRIGFIAGASVGTLGGLLASAGMFTSSLPLLCLGTFLAGTYQGLAQFYRFAAAEVARDTFKPPAISLVLGGGLVAALVGPLLARIGGDLLQPAYTASFLFLALAPVLAVGVMLGVNVPKSVDTAEDKAAARSLRDIVRQPTYLVALFGAVTGYGVMILAMTATPLAMVHHDHSQRLPLLKRVVVGDDHLGIAKLHHHLGRHQFSGSIVVFVVGWHQYAQSILDRDPWRHDQKATRKQRRVGLPRIIDGLRGNQHGHHSRLSGACR